MVPWWCRANGTNRCLFFQQRPGGHILPLIFGQLWNKKSSVGSFWSGLSPSSTLPSSLTANHNLPIRCHLKPRLLFELRNIHPVPRTFPKDASPHSPPFNKSSHYPCMLCMQTQIVKSWTIPQTWTKNTSLRWHLWLAGKKVEVKRQWNPFFFKPQAIVLLGAKRSPKPAHNETETGFINMSTNSVLPLKLFPQWRVEH